MVAILAGLLLALLASSVVFANGRPIQIVLSYLPNVSNTGPESATGVAELVMAEGEVRVAATGLPRLDPPQRYVAWVVNTTTNESMSLGSFNTAFTTGDARLDQVLPEEIPDRGWNLFMVTIESEASPQEPSGQTAIAGYFPPTGETELPQQLPNTGGIPIMPPETNRPDWTLVAGLVALTLLVGGAAGYAVGRKRSTAR